MPDWKEAAPRSAGSKDFTETEKTAAAFRLQAFMQSLQDAGDQVKKPDRCANMFHAQAMDASLYSITGLALRDFLPERRPRALSPWERRFFVTDGELGVALRPGCTAAHRRSCILDTRNGNTWIEVPLTTGNNGDILYRTFFGCLDQGSVGWPTHQWLMWDQGVRGDFIMDPAHRCMRDSGDSLGDAGTWPIIAEFACVWNLPGGPWQGAMFYQVIQRAARDFFGQLTPDNELWRFFYPRLSKDFAMMSEAFWCGSGRNPRRLFAARVGM